MKSYQGILLYVCVYFSNALSLHTLMQATYSVEQMLTPTLFPCLHLISGIGDIFDVSWNDGEDWVAACFSTNVLAVIDLRM